MGSLPRLELMRVACNRLRAVPDSFAGLDALAWFSLGGNPACAPAPSARYGVGWLLLACCNSLLCLPVVHATCFAAASSLL